MLNGRHLVLLGIIACGGLVSVHDGQRQTKLRYELADIEKQLRDTRSEIELSRIRHQSLQSPRAVMERAATLNLKVGPPAMPSPEMPAPQPAQPQREVPRSLGQPEGARPVPASRSTRAPGGARQP
jgi:hypothetical protein